MELQHRHSAGFWRKLICWVCVGIGLLGILLPIIPGIPFLIAGLLSLSTEHRWIRAFLVMAKRKLARISPRISKLPRVPRRNSRPLNRQVKEHP
jgi:hypothetical protein